MRADRYIALRPDASLPPWSLFVEDEDGNPWSYAGETTFVVKVRTATSTWAVAGSMTAHAAASLTGDRGLGPLDVPTLRFSPVAASLALVPAVRARAEILVYVGTGNVERHEFPARVIP